MKASLVASILITLAAAPLAAGPTSLCGGSSGFLGEVIIGQLAPSTVDLDWTLFEDDGVVGYRLSRYAPGCDKPKACGVALAHIRAAAPAALRPRSYTDTPPAGVWTYRLEVLRRHGASCSLETTVVVPSAPGCGAAAVCTELSQSFASELVLDGPAAGAFRLAWQTASENGEVSGYRLTRRDCDDPAACSVEVALVSATGSCGERLDRSLTDAAPTGSWTWRIEALGSSAEPLCSVDAVGDLPTTR